MFIQIQWNPSLHLVFFFQEALLDSVYNLGKTRQQIYYMQIYYSLEGQIYNPEPLMDQPFQHQQVKNIKHKKLLSF